MKATAALFLVFAMQACSFAHADAQAPSAIGSWQIDLTFTDTSHHTLRFDADDAGKSSLLLLDRVSSLLDPPKPAPAEWVQTGTAVNFSGGIEFPIGNVGRNAGTLVFSGVLETNDSMTGDVAFFGEGQDPKDPKASPTMTGVFRATRITVKGTTSVTLLSLDSGGKVRRGEEVEIDWLAESKIPISAQQLFLSIDHGESFFPITDVLTGDMTHVTWSVPETLPKAKKSLLKIVVFNAVGDGAEDTSSQTFKIK